MNIALMDNMRLPPSLSRTTTSAAFARILFQVLSWCLRRWWNWEKDWMRGSVLRGS
jgi:hypothetical protein